MNTTQSILWFDDIHIADIALVGGKNASLGEIVRSLKASHIPVPPGFATSAQMYRDFVNNNHLQHLIDEQVAAYKTGKQSLAQTGAAIREGFVWGEFDRDQVEAISSAYLQLCERVGRQNCDVAVRSSATAEDLPEASFAGQQESYLNISSAPALLEACRSCYASLFTDRAIVYRDEQGYSHQQVALSIGVQQMVRSDLACAGVMFTLDTESGFRNVVTLSAAWGLGESVVKGSVNPDRYMVYKPLLNDGGRRPIIEKTRGSKREKLVYAPERTVAGEQSMLNNTTKVVATSEQERSALVLSDEEVLTLARWACVIEQHYDRPMDIEWAKDGVCGDLYIVQARPETIESQKKHNVLQRFQLKQTSPVLLTGASVGSAIAGGQAFYLDDPAQQESFPDGAILVAERTDPDWVPIMRRAAGIITDSGGPTSHAAIVSRELKVPAIVGTGDASLRLTTGSDVTLNCSEGAVGKVHQGILAYDTQSICLDDVPHTTTDIMINVALPDSAIAWWQLPVAGIGLTRIEFIISGLIGIHPMALLHPEKILDDTVLEKIRDITQQTTTPSDFFVQQLALGVGKIAASVYPRPVVVRMSDFKSNEYRGLLGGEFFEIDEENPMLGLRGASRYYHPLYREAFALECQAIKQAREAMGFDNIIVMIPFCRTPDEADKVLEVMAEAGLVRGENALQVYVMCEIPSNIILAEQFAKRFDGFSIGSNDLTQLVLGIDRDSAELKYLFDPRNEAIKRVIADVIKTAHHYHCKVGICGQAPSDYPEFAHFLVGCGIDSISLNPDSVLTATQQIHDAEQQR